MAPRMETYLFWDIVEYPPPKDCDLASFYENIRLVLLDEGYYNGHLTINAYGEADENLYKEFDYLALPFHVVRQGSRFERLSAMALDMLALVIRDDPYMPQPQHINFFLILKDTPEDNSELSSVVRFLRERHYNFVLVVSDDDDGGVDSAYPLLKEEQSSFTVWRWSSLVGDHVRDSSSEEDSEDYDSDDKEEEVSSPKRPKMIDE